MIIYGDILFNGNIQGVRDFKKAAEYYRKAADEHNNRIAMVKYGNMLRYGFGVKINKDKAKEYFNKAGNAEGKANLDALIYRESHQNNQNEQNTVPPASAQSVPKTNLSTTKKDHVGTGKQSSSPNNS